MVSLERQLSELAVEPCLAAFVSFLVIFARTGRRAAGELPSDAASRVDGLVGGGGAAAAWAELCETHGPARQRCIGRRVWQARGRLAVVVALETRHGGLDGRGEES